MSFAVASDQKPLIAGVGMVRFTKPGQSDPWDQLGESAARLALEDAKVSYEDIQIAHVGSAEATFGESLRLCAVGEFEKYEQDGNNTYGGSHVVNPSGGLLAKGHPLGATGLAQCHELVHQIRGTAGERQVPDVRLALAHNTGLGGATVVTMLRAP